MAIMPLERAKISRRMSPHIVAALAIVTDPAAERHAPR
jgi:hypothetical protein